MENNTRSLGRVMVYYGPCVEGYSGFLVALEREKIGEFANFHGVVQATVGPNVSVKVLCSPIHDEWIRLIVMVKNRRSIDLYKFRRRFSEKLSEHIERWRVQQSKLIKQKA